MPPMPPCPCPGRLAIQGVEELTDAIMAGLPAAGIAGTAPIAPDVARHQADWLRHAEQAAARLAPGDDWFLRRLKDAITRRTERLSNGQRAEARRARNMLLAAVLADRAPEDQVALLALGPAIRRAWRDAPAAVRAAIRARLAINASGVEPPFTYAAHARCWFASMRRRRHPALFLEMDLAAEDFNEVPRDLRRRLLADQMALAAKYDHGGPIALAEDPRKSVIAVNSK